MRGVVIFLTALFMLAPYYLIMTMAIEPLIRILTAGSTNYAPFAGINTIETLKDVLFIYGPFVYVGSWFLWSARYYYSRAVFVGEAGGGRRPP